MPLTKHHGTRTAIAFAAPFFGARTAQVFPQHFQKGPAGWYIVHKDWLTSLDKANGFKGRQRVHISKGKPF